MEDFRRFTTQEAKELRASRKGQEEGEGPPKGVAAKTVEIEIDQTHNSPFGEAAKSSKSTKSGRQIAKRKYSREDQQPRDEEHDESTVPARKKLRSTSGKEQLKIDRSEPSANLGRTRATRMRKQTYRPSPDKIEEPDNDNQPSPSAAARKRPRKNATK